MGNLVQNVKGIFSEVIDFWVPLLEKAFAKFCGSYQNIIGGQCGEGLFYLTGGVTLRLGLDDDMIKKINAAPKVRLLVGYLPTPYP